MSKVGYVFSGGDSRLQNDVLTWHDVKGYRVWVHSKASGSSREVISLEIQVVDKSATKPSKDEESLRLKLCSLSQVAKNYQPLNSTSLRTLPTGQILDEHSEVISRILNNNSSKKTRSVKLVEDVSSKTLDLKVSLHWDSSEEILTENGKSKDAIIIAKVYEMLQSTGTRKLSARTAELLGVDVSVVHTAVQVARRNKWLTSNGVGQSGGVLTEKGNEAFQKAKGPQRLARIMDELKGK